MSNNPGGNIIVAKLGNIAYSYRDLYWFASNLFFGNDNEKAKSFIEDKCNKREAIEYINYRKLLPFIYYEINIISRKEIIVSNTNTKEVASFTDEKLLDQFYWIFFKSLRDHNSYYRHLTEDKMDEYFNKYKEYQAVRGKINKLDS